MAPSVVEKNGESCGDENHESQENFGLTTCRSSPPPRTYSPPGVERKLSAHDVSTSLDPPVTKKTLGELDVNRIVQNPKLRHDINFDPDLHFRPNLDGEKGRRKTQKQDEFYETMRIQLGSYLTDREAFESQLKEDEDWCLPGTLKAIEGIIETLVPQRDRSTVKESFNVDLLMQQFRKGVADLPKLALWLSQLLKCHCAPMRDPWVDEMVMQISKGDREGDVALLVLGMRNLLGVLEAMKLDVANHQIRCLRPLLIQDTVHFEQKFFLKKIATRRVDIDGARAWYERLQDLPDLGMPTQPQCNFWNFMKGLVNLTLQSKSNEMVPHTFLFDEERLIKLRADIEDLIKLEICMHMFSELERCYRIQAARSIADVDTPTSSGMSTPYSRPGSPADRSFVVPFNTRLPLPHHFRERGFLRTSPSGQQQWIPGMDDEGNTTPLASSSPRSSPSSTSSTPDTCPSTPLYANLPYMNTFSTVRSSLQAILASCNAPDRWSQMAPDLALRIVDAANASLARLPYLEQHLEYHLTNPNSSLYKAAEERVLKQLFPALRSLVDCYTPLTNHQMFERATAPMPAVKHPSAQNKEEVEDIATRIAHIGVLHWRVWAPLAYLVNPGMNQEEQSASFGRASSVP
ncbi:T-complex protein 11-domain-containing protein [Calycina marina]|uniref:T-complex protein 11-domain-containing protein n=1 Tax=Calycina marina TaxID=1763456 RepID=A0A9P7Z6L7_9HELO|nr:T-complex protein 11-domain-containing protein [Calycina marina]